MFLELDLLHGDAMTSAPVNLTTFLERYSTDEHCREALANLRFPRWREMPKVQERERCAGLRP